MGISLHKVHVLYFLKTEWEVHLSFLLLFFARCSIFWLYFGDVFECGGFAFYPMGSVFWIIDGQRNEDVPQKFKPTRLNFRRIL